ncbi:Tol-Pal system beta propeller repeat protein TolB [Parvularcula sp. LCG005]|uniref:Tol-Pal system beta propeller repeat protein TolB n=1 Tax=Parvularcula sp. LCG005 TaxID=3078805 RepID=UPI002943D880|nr:Tol-Pal system beta propeller repeat protein TolB [Parvularcula sp. LCG005]WOI53940.1 Tol-Pal system beta propeller repeat protein TolB [Parvularcula sp. LCG005]
MRLKTLRPLAVSLLALMPFSMPQAMAQDVPEIDITRGRSEPMPIAAPNFIASTPGAMEISARMNEVIEGDLERSGLFAPIDDRAFIEQLSTVNVRPRFPDWRMINATVLLVGELEEEADGTMRVIVRLWDVYGNQQLGNMAFRMRSDNWRRQSHKIADFVYETLTGEEGYFDTRIVFVGESGPKVDRKKQLMIMDQDGANPSVLTDGLGYQALTPRFSPTSQQITYLALFDDKPAQVYLYSLETTAQEALGSFRGMTFSPRFTPDGNGLLFSIEENGNTEVAKMDLPTRRITKLTNNPAIDTSPSMSPDGSQIAFASDRGGSQQIYVMNADGTNQRRITFGDGIYGTPVWSPRGDLVAFTRQYKSRFYIGVVGTDGSNERLLTESYLDEGPTWSPNGRVIMFFREDRPGGPVGLYSVDLTGQNLRKVPTPVEASDPAWSPPLK